MLTDLQLLKSGTAALISGDNVSAPSTGIQQQTTSAISIPRLRSFYLAIGAGAVILAVLAAGVWLNYKRKVDTQPVSTAQQTGIPSIAVLPFVNMSTDKGTGIFF